MIMWQFAWNLRIFVKNRHHLGGRGKKAERDAQETPGKVIFCILMRSYPCQSSEYDLLPPFAKLFPV